MGAGEELKMLARQPEGWREKLKVLEGFHTPLWLHLAGGENAL